MSKHSSFREDENCDNMSFDELSCEEDLPTQKILNYVRSEQIIANISKTLEVSHKMNPLLIQKGYRTMNIDEY